MRKMKLDIEELRVDSFDTSMREAVRSGTVRGHATGYLETCGTHVHNTCDEACGWTRACPDQTMAIECNATQGSACSLQSPYQTACDYSCEFSCPITVAGVGEC